MSSLSTHVLDAVTGAPASDVTVELLAPGDTGWASLQEGRTDADGRLRLSEAGLWPGVFRLVFGTGDYFRAQGVPAFFPEVVVAFEVTEERHYHVPLLLSPYAYSTYRGS